VTELLSLGDSLLDSVLSEYSTLVPGSPSLSNRRFDLERGRSLLCLKTVSESKCSFLLSLPAGERFPGLDFT
jgi:hypothetical protein